MKKTEDPPERPQGIKRAKFHRNHFCLCEEAIKELQGDNRGELFGI